MNELVKKYLDERNKAIEDKQKEAKEKTLIELGLYTEHKVFAEPKLEHIKYPYNMYDADTDNYYYNKKVAVEVSDTEYEQILAVAPKKEKPMDPDISLNKDSELKGWGTFLVVLGILELLAGIIIAVIADDVTYAGVGLLLLFVCLIGGTFLKVVTNMSVRIDEINRKIS